MPAVKNNLLRPKVPQLPKSPFESTEDAPNEVSALREYSDYSLSKQGVSGAVTPSAYSFASDDPVEFGVPKALQSRRKSIFSRAKRKKPHTPLGARRTSITSSLFHRKRKDKSWASSINGDEFPASGVTFNLEPEIADPGLLSDDQRGDMAARATAFEENTYNLWNDVRYLDKEGIIRLRLQLSAAARESGAKIEHLLHQHYPAFISASKGIQAMEKETQALRGFLTREKVLLSSLKEIAGSEGREGEKNDLDANTRPGYTRAWADSPEGLRWNSALQTLDIAIAERRPVDALTLLRKAEKTLLPGQKSGLYSHSLAGSPNVKTERQAKELVLRRHTLMELVSGLIKVTTIGSTRLQTATQVLGSLAGRCHAMRAYLDAHTAQLRRLNVALLKNHQAGGDTDGTEFANALSQQVFGAIAAACEDSQITFGKDLKELNAMLMVWALGETERCATLLKRHALSPFAAQAGLGPTISCISLAYVHCTALKLSHGLYLMPRLARDLWGTVDQVLQRRVKRISEDAKAAAKTEIERFLEQSDMDAVFLEKHQNGGDSWSSLLEIFPSADVLLDEIETITNLCRPIEGPRIREALEHAYTRLFRDYTNAIGEVVKYYRDIERDRCNAEQAEKIKKDSIEIPKPAKKGRRASNLQEVMNHSNMRLLVNFSERRRQQVSETKAIRKDADRDLPPNMVPVVAAGLKIASAIKDQFLPELSKPLSGCGSLCNNAQLEQQMRVFKHIMRPENMNANVSDFTVPTENVVERQESALLLLEEPQPTRGRHGSNGRESVHSFASSSKSSRRSGWRQYRPMDTRLSSILNSHQSGASDGIEQDSDAGHEEEQEEDDEKAFEALSTRSESMAPVNKENTRAPIENPFAKLGLARGNTNAFAFFNDWSERQIQASQKLEAPAKQKSEDQNGSSPNKSQRNGLPPRPQFDPSQLKSALKSSARNNSAGSGTSRAASVSGSESNRDSQPSDNEPDVQGFHNSVKVMRTPFGEVGAFSESENQPRSISDPIESPFLNGVGKDKMKPRQVQVSFAEEKHDSDEIEEMNEELFELDEDEFVAQLTKKAGGDSTFYL